MKIAKGLRCSVDELLVGVDPAYDRIREAGGMAGAEPLRLDSQPAATAGIPVVEEGKASPVSSTSGDRTVERSGVVRWVCPPGDLHDPNAYGIQVRGDSMIPAHRPNSVAIASPRRRV